MNTMTLKESVTEQNVVTRLKKKKKKREICLGNQNPWRDLGNLNHGDTKKRKKQGDYRETKTIEFTWKPKPMVKPWGPNNMKIKGKPNPRVIPGRPKTIEISGEKSH